MTTRSLCLAIALSFAVAAPPAGAQQTERVPIVGVLATAAASDDPILEALRQGLRELGYVEGRNIRIEFRTAQGHADRLPALAEELVQLKVDLIIATSSSVAQAVQHATSTIPIVMVGDPVGSRLVTNLAHPGGNVTGLSVMTVELSAKRLQLLKEALPRLTRVTVLWNPDTLSTAAQQKIAEDLKAAAHSLSFELSFVSARTPEEIGPAFSAVSRAHAQALLVIESPLFFVHRTTLTNLASMARLPAMYGPGEFANEGGLMCYGANYGDVYRRSAGYVDKILKGAKPADLPIEQPTRFEFVVNLKTAKALGITIPQSILLRADEVIQ